MKGIDRMWQRKQGDFIAHDAQISPYFTLYGSELKCHGLIDDSSMPMKCVQHVQAH